MNAKQSRAGSTAYRLQEASRLQFDGLASLHVAQKELSLKEAELNAMRLSTSWRVTSPLRWAVNKFQSFRQKSSHDAFMPLVQSNVASGKVDVSFDYARWITDSEPRLIQGMLSARPGFGPVLIPTLGFVRLGNGETTTMVGRVVAGEMAGSGPSIPASVDEPEIIRLSLQAVEADFFCLIDRGCETSPHALELVVNRLARQPDIDILFADEDVRSPSGDRVQPFFKPAWDARLQLGRNLAGPVVVVRRALLRGLDVTAGPAWLYDLVNQAVALVRPEQIGHIPAVLAHRFQLPTGYADAMADAARAELRRANVAGRVVPIVDRPGWQRVTYELPTPKPLVSIIVPTRNRADLLQACAEGVLERTDYDHLELLLVDNGSVEQDALALLEKLKQDTRVTVRRDGRPFNWAALNNEAARHASGEILLLLNNDVSISDPNWLTELVSLAVQPNVGAVGAKLLYADGSIQHAGITVDHAGYPFHLLRHAAGDGFGPWDLLGLARSVWGVTGACMAMRRTVFLEVGGLNEALPVACNDVDLCLRLTMHGYDIVWTPWAVLEHPELGTRKPDTDPSRRAAAAEEMTRLWRDWGALLWHDPYLSPNLELDGEQLRLRKPRGPGR